MIYLLGVKPRKLWMNAICGDVIKIGQVTNSAKSVLLLIDLEISTNNVCIIHVNPVKKETPHSFKGQQLENKSLNRFEIYTGLWIFGFFFEGFRTN